MSVVSYTKAKIDALLGGKQDAGDYATNTALTAGLAGRLAAAASLSDLPNAATARTNLGLGSAAIQPATAFDASGAAAAAQAAAVQRANHTGTQAASTVTGLSTVATSGAYTDLSGKPTIPAAYTDAQAQAANSTALATKANIADIGTAGTATGDALKAAYVPKWKASTAYASGEFVLNPSGQIVSANTAHTSGASYTAGNWTLVSGGVGGGSYVPIGTTNYTGSPAAPFIEVNNASSASSIHLTQAAGFTGAYLLGIGNDTGNMPGALISNKAAGIGLVVKQNSTITSSTAYGIQVDQQSTLSAGVRIEGNVANAADLLQVLNFTTSNDSNKNLLYVGDLTGQIGRIRASDGVFNWLRDFEIWDSAANARNRFMARNQAGVDTTGLRMSYLDHRGVTSLSATGSANLWWAFRTKAEGTALSFQGLGTVGATDANTLAAITGTTSLSISHDGKLGFFTTTPVAQPTRVGQLTAASGTASATITDVGAAFAQATLNNNFASLAAKLNAIESRLSQAGGGVGVTA